IRSARYHGKLTAKSFAVRCPANVCSCKHGSRLPGLSRKIFRIAPGQLSCRRADDNGLLPDIYADQRPPFHLPHHFPDKLSFRHLPVSLDESVPVRFFYLPDHLLKLHDLYPDRIILLRFPLSVLHLLTYLTAAQEQDIRHPGIPRKRLPDPAVFSLHEK